MEDKLPVLACVTRTKSGSPSKLGLFSKCRLRYLLESERTEAVRIPSGVMVLRGIAVHKVIEKYGGGETLSGIKLKTIVIDAITDAIGRRSAGELILDVFEKHGINGLFSRSQILDACHFVKRRIGRYKPASDQRIVYSSSERLERSDARGKENLFGSEKWFSDRELDLAGQIDLCFKDETDVVHVVDFKTGRVTDSEGIPKEDYLLQLGAYGILVKRAFNLNSVVLELSGSSTSWVGVLDKKLENQIESILHSLRNTLPRDQNFNSADLASMGEHCIDCSCRPSCGHYRQTLLNNMDHIFVSGKDISGVVIGMKLIANYTEIQIRSTRGSIASIAGVPASLSDAIKVGARLTGFDLGIFDRVERSIFPSNFYMYRADSVRESAFSSFLAVENC